MKYVSKMSFTKWRQFWSGRIEASYRFALHDYLTRPRAYATISTAETCFKLINSSWPLRRPRPEPSCLLPPSSWLADKSCLPRTSGELRGQQPGVVLDCCRGSGSYTRLRIHTSVWWGNNSLTNNVMLIYTTIKENNTNVYTLILFGADKRLESILIKLIKSNLFMA